MTGPTAVLPQAVVVCTSPDGSINHASADLVVDPSGGAVHVALVVPHIPGTVRLVMRPSQAYALLDELAQAAFIAEEQAQGVKL